MSETLKVVIPPHIEAAIAQTQAEQSAADAVGLDAGGAALPGPTRDVFKPAPDLPVKDSPWIVRRFVNRDFMHLAAIGHPLNHLSKIPEWSEKVDPTSAETAQLCFLMTRPNEATKALLKQGPQAFKDAADAEFGDQTPFGITPVLVAIAEQLRIYAIPHLDFQYPEGKNGGDSPPPSSQP